uniref:alpha-1,2-Mannosidase n=1 Tax=Heterorhabditis bacteriophora TaxID=37862 RepID=A0A1I7WTL1_HETBA
MLGYFVYLEWVMGLKIHEKYVIGVGVLFLATVCLSSLFFLPSSGAEDYLHSGHLVPHIRDSNARRHLQQQEQETLRRKIEEANIIPPPIPKPEIGASDDVEGRRIFIKQMMKFAWDGYRRYAWGSNELSPISKTGHSASVFGSGDIGASIVDAIDTLWIMGLKEEYEDARKWIDLNLDFSRTAKGDLSVFETNIRFIGGLLSIYALTNDQVLRIREVLMELEKPDGLYPIYLNPKTGKWGQRDFSIGAMADSFYEYLLKHWLITGKKDMKTKAQYDEAIFAMEKKMLFESKQNLVNGKYLVKWRDLSRKCTTLRRYVFDELITESLLGFSGEVSTHLSRILRSIWLAIGFLLHNYSSVLIMIYFILNS